MHAIDSSRPHASPERLAAFCTDVLTSIGVEATSADAASSAKMHGSIHGVDSHGVRPVGHYFRAYEGGRPKKSPNLKINRVRSATSLLDADHARGAHATYAATDLAGEMAAETGFAASMVSPSIPRQEKILRGSHLRSALHRHCHVNLLMPRKRVLYEAPCPDLCTPDTVSHPRSSNTLSGCIFAFR